MKNFDDVWEKLPHFSLYQWFMTLLAAGWLSAVIGVSALFPVFGQWTPEFHCQTQLDDHFANISFEEREDLLRQFCGSFGECSTTCDFMIPIECHSANSSSLISSCLSDHELQFVTRNNSCSAFSFNYEALGVPKGHQNLIFSKGHPDAWKTTVTDFAPICSRALVGTFMLSASIIGQTLGSFFVGIYSDRFGRKNAIFVFNIVFVISTIALALIRNEYSFIIMRILMNFSSVIMYVAALTYGVELTGPSKRSLPGTFISIYFGLGYMGSSIVGYFIPHWQGHALAIGIMAALQLILTFFLPESPSFLVAKKRYKEACRVLEKIAVKTSSDVGADLEEKLKNIQEPQKEDRSPLDLFRTSATRRVSLNLAYAFCVTVTVYYALSFNVSSLAGSTYVNNALNGAVETVAYFICIPLIDKFGRRPVTVIFMYIGSIAILLVMILNETTDAKAAQETARWMAFLGKFCISGVFNNIFIYAAEIYPTEIRTVGVGSTSMIGRVAAIVMPFILDLQNKPGLAWFPYTLFGAMGLLSATWMIWLPETNNAPLTQTIEEAENFYESCSRNSKKIHADPDEIQIEIQS